MSRGSAAGCAPEEPARCLIPSIPRGSPRARDAAVEYLDLIGECRVGARAGREGAGREAALPEEASRRCGPGRSSAPSAPGVHGLHFHYVVGGATPRPSRPTGSPPSIRSRRPPPARPRGRPRGPLRALASSSNSPPTKGPACSSPVRPRTPGSGRPPARARPVGHDASERGSRARPVHATRASSTRAVARRPRSRPRRDRALLRGQPGHPHEAARRHRGARARAGDSWARPGGEQRTPPRPPRRVRSTERVHVDAAFGAFARVTPRASAVWGRARRLHRRGRAQVAQRPLRLRLRAPAHRDATARTFRSAPYLPRRGRGAARSRAGEPHAREQPPRAGAPVFATLLARGRRDPRDGRAAPRPPPSPTRSARPRNLSRGRPALNVAPLRAGRREADLTSSTKAGRACSTTAASPCSCATAASCLRPAIANWRTGEDDVRLVSRSSASSARGCSTTLRHTARSGEVAAADRPWSMDPLRHIVDAKIKEAQDDGVFDDLPGKGKPSSSPTTRAYRRSVARTPQAGMLPEEMERRSPS